MWKRSLLNKWLDKVRSIENDIANMDEELPLIDKIIEQEENSDLVFEIILTLKRIKKKI